MKQFFSPFFGLVNWWLQASQQQIKPCMYFKLLLKVTSFSTKQEAKTLLDIIERFYNHQAVKTGRNRYAVDKSSIWFTI